MASKDARTYIRVHDGMPDHPKVVGLSDAAFRLYVEALCWCSRHLTDGRMPAAALRKLGAPKSQQELAAAGLVEIAGADWQVHDYLEHQRSADEVAEMRERRRNAGRKGGLAKAQGLANARGDAKQNGGIDRDIDREVPIGTSCESTPKRKKPAHDVPADWHPSEQLLAWSAEKFPQVDPLPEVPRFVDYHRARGNRFSDVNAAWRTWISNQARWAAERSSARNAGVAADGGYSGWRG